MVLPYGELGTGPAVMLLHAGICDRGMWNETMEALAAADRRAIAVDLPGYGDAALDASRPHAPWEDVLATLDELGVEQAALVGVSAGGGVALRLAAVAPGRVSALCLVSARPISDAPPSPELQSAFDAEVGPAVAGDLDGAVAGVLGHWLMPGAPARLRDRVSAMERRSLEIQLAAGDPPRRLTRWRIGQTPWRRSPPPASSASASTTFPTSTLQPPSWRAGCRARRTLSWSFLAPVTSRHWRHRTSFGFGCWTS